MKFRPGDLVRWTGNDAIGLVVSEMADGSLRVYWMWKDKKTARFDSCFWRERSLGECFCEGIIR